MPESLGTYRLSPLQLKDSEQGNWLRYDGLIFIP
jgi:hypothetical protein